MLRCMDEKYFMCTLEQLRKNIFYDISIVELDSIVLDVIKKRIVAIQ